MSKVEIDTSEVSLEGQMREALKAYGFNTAPCNALFMLEAFAASKFSKQPLPEIVKPKWALYAWVICNESLPWPYYVQASTSPRGQPIDPIADSYMIGPSRNTEREAILAFNALFGDGPIL